MRESENADDRDEDDGGLCFCVYCGSSHISDEAQQDQCAFRPKRRKLCSATLADPLFQTATLKMVTDGPAANAASAVIDIDRLPGYDDLEFASNSSVSGSLSTRWVDFPEAERSQILCISKSLAQIGLQLDDEIDPPRSRQTAGALWQAMRAFVRSLTSAAVQIYRDEKQASADSAAAIKVLVPLHVYKGILANEHLEFLSNRFTQLPDPGI